MCFDISVIRIFVKHMPCTYALYIFLMVMYYVFMEQLQFKHMHDRTIKLFSFVASAADMHKIFDELREDVMSGLNADMSLRDLEPLMNNKKCKIFISA